jgi:hypothetical protein
MPLFALAHGVLKAVAKLSHKTNTNLESLAITFSDNFWNISQFSVFVKKYT